VATPASTSQGPRPRKPRGVRSAVANLPATPLLDDALEICRLLLEKEPNGGAVKWLGRLLLEQLSVSLRRAELVAANLAAWPNPARHDAANEACAQLGRGVGLRRLGARLAGADDG
jgi:hypothetical protein